MVLCGLLKAKKPMLWLRSPQLVVGKVGAKAARWFRLTELLEEECLRTRECVNENLGSTAS
jgi:hypothetical protein